MTARRGLRYRWYRFLRRHVCSRLGHKWRTTGNFTGCRRCRLAA